MDVPFLLQCLMYFYQKRRPFKEIFTPLFAGHEVDLKSNFSGQSDNCVVCTFSCTDQEKNKICERHADKFDGHTRSTSIKQEDVCPEDQNISPE